MNYFSLNLLKVHVLINSILFSLTKTKSLDTLDHFYIYEVIEVHTLRPESSENIPILLQEAHLHFSNQNDLRNPKLGSKQSGVVATEW